MRILEEVVEPAGRRLRLGEDRGRDSEYDETERRRKHEIHQRDRQPARQPDPLERPHERIEQQRALAQFAIRIVDVVSVKCNARTTSETEERLSKLSQSGLGDTNRC